MSFFSDLKQKKSNKKDDMQSVAKPLTQSEDFCAELMDGTMDFSKIQNEQFIVAVSTGDRNKPGLLASTIRGPFSFYDMVESVGRMWEREQHHAKVIVLTQDFEKTPSFLDQGTIDYIEARWADIVATGILEAGILDAEEVTMTAGLIDTNVED